MELSDLTAYAEERYHIREQRRWDPFPGLSVLADPKTGAWVALLMREWDTQTGMEVQRCDIKCGQGALREFRVPFLTRPFRMKSPKWVGVVIDQDTDAALVCRLLDRALEGGPAGDAVRRGFEIVLEPPGESAAGEGVAGEGAVAPRQETLVPAGGGAFHATEIRVPEKILEMRELSEPAPMSPEDRKRVFYRQGKLMEDYEDDQEWARGGVRRYSATYQDLNVRQLRGYFTWRARVRKGDYLPAPAAFAYLYLYELLNGIGAASPEEALRKMGEFEEGFLDAGLGDERMRRTLRRWMFEYAVLAGLPAEVARSLADAAVLARDHALAVLKEPAARPDAEVFEALCTLAGKDLHGSAVLKKDAEAGEHLFAAVWRFGSTWRTATGKGLMALCFGSEAPYRWHPLESAVVWREAPHEDAVFELDECRSFHCEGGVWTERKYEPLFFDQGAFAGFLRETDRILRERLRTGHYLKARGEEAWATPLVEAALAEERQRQAEASRPKVDIDFSELGQIRADASVTRESLLTEEERAAEEEDEAGAGAEEEAEVEAETEAEVEAHDSPNTGGDDGPLDSTGRAVLAALLRGEDPAPLLERGHLMPSLVADSINEQVFDILGDNVLECRGDALSLVEDYREDLEEILGESGR